MRLRLASAVLLTLPLQAADWPQWRGPQRDGISRETGWSATFPAGGPKVLWQAEVGLGFSTFVVADGRAYTTGHANKTDTIYGFDAQSGRTLWTHTYPAELGDKFFEGGATGTPTYADGVLYHVSRWGDLFSLDAASGKVLWKKNIHEETGIRLPDWGYTGSPTVWQDLLILNIGSAGVAVKKTDGSIVWKSADKDAGYSTPLPFEYQGQTYVTFGTGRSYIAVHARTGKTLWEHRWSTSYGVNASDPILKDNFIFISTGYNKGATLLKMDGPNLSEIWTSREMRTQMNAALLVGDYLYGIDGNENHTANLKCIEFSTGNPVWIHEGLAHGAISVADDKLIVLSERGELLIAPASPQGFKPMARAQVLNGKCWAVPVLANGLLYVRTTQGTVKCLDLRRS